MKRWALAALVLVCSCSSFLKKEHIEGLKVYEEGQYVMKQDAGPEESSLRKGTTVRLIVQTGGDFLKVYAYSASVDFLKADRVLILFLLDDDFQDKVFDKRYFEERLYRLVEARKS